MIPLLAQSMGRENFAEPESNIGGISETLATRLDVLSQPDSLVHILTQIHLVWAVIFILVGIACVLNGYRWRKIVVIVLAALAGVWAGRMLGLQIGSGAIAAICFAILFAVIAWPLLRYSVALFGGLAGAFAGANMWTAFELPADQHKIGALVGLLVVGMLTFMAFRVVVVIMTAIGGASLLVFGVLAALMHVESWETGLTNGLMRNDLLVPIAAGSAAIIGAVIQFSGGFKGMAQLADNADEQHPASAEKKIAA